MTEVKRTRSELKREAIVKATIKAFHDNGINETSMDTIAQLANVSKRTVYNHFESKEKLVTEIFKEMWDQAQMLIEQEYQPNEPLNEQLATILRGEARYMGCATFIEMVRFALGYFIHKTDEMRDYSDQFMQADTSLKRWLKSAMEDKRLKPLDVELANNQLLGLIKEQAFWPQVLRRDLCLNESEQEQLVNNCVGMFLAYYQA